MNNGNGSPSEVMDAITQNCRGYTTEYVARHINMMMTSKVDVLAPASGAYSLRRIDDTILCDIRNDGKNDYEINADLAVYDMLGVQTIIDDNLAAELKETIHE